MAKERIVVAHFDGQSVERGSISKIYTHAWRVTGTEPRERMESWNQRVAPEHRVDAPRVSEEIGFSTSDDKARKAAATAYAWRNNAAYTELRSEIVPVTEIAERTTARDRAVRRYAEGRRQAVVGDLAHRIRQAAEPSTRE